MSSGIYTYLWPAVISLGVATLASTITACRVRRQIGEIENQVQALTSRVTALQSMVQQPLPSAPIYPPQAQYAIAQYVPGANPNYWTSVNI